MGFEDGVNNETSKAVQEIIPPEGVSLAEKIVETPEDGVSQFDLALGEMAQTEDLLRLEDQATQFRGTIEKLGIPWSADTAEQYENDYALPATLQAETLQGVIAQNNDVRYEAAQESKERKNFNEVSCIMEDKKALCIHFMTGLSNELNGATGTNAISTDKFDSMSQDKKDHGALSQLKTLMSLNPSISTSFFADSHKFEGSWWRGLSQPIGAIFREGDCVGISSQDASTKSRSVKKRYGAEPVTEEYLAKVLSEDDGHFTKSGYNEAVVSEPKIGALFMPTNGSVSREILQTLYNESSSCGYLVLLESHGDFFELSQEHIALLLVGDESRISVESFLRDKFMVSREDIRQRIAVLDSQELQEKEKKRFDTYLEHYDLRPHFSWSEELATTIDTEIAFHLSQEARQLEGYEKNLRIESETEGALTKRLFEYFTQHPDTQTSSEVIKRIYVNDVLYEAGEDNFLAEQEAGLFSDAKVETRVTKDWKYEQVIDDPPVLVEGVQGVGEVSNIQKSRRIRMHVMQYPDGSVFYDASENMSLLVNTTNAKTGELIRSNNAVHYLSSETMEETPEGTKREAGSFKKDVQNNYRPDVVRYQGGNSFIDTPDDIRQKIADNAFGADKLKQVSLYAQTLAEMYQQSSDGAMKNEWQKIAESISSDTHNRYAFIRSKLNRDGTLKLDKDDVAEL